MKLKDLLYQYRVNNSLTMEEFAERCGLTKGCISMLESGKNPRSGRPLTPKLATLNKLAGGMHITLDDLLRSVDSFPISLRAGTDDPIFPTAKEEKLLDLFRKLNAAGQNKLIDSAEDLVASGRYIYRASGTHDH